ncbi:BON domain-containing protein [Sinirhodobacter ferrireducens]|uniref:BON domain-containing protein n=2 Tax=Paenirhodobacter ferrireducens TaxID=1215032 RepID=A0A443LQ78_9RHOB|nr:BON domain-containing protein [Sinirhodobacter ferrireducens]
MTVRPAHRPVGISCAHLFSAASKAALKRHKMTRSIFPAACPPLILAGTVALCGLFLAPPVRAQSGGDGAAAPQIETGTPTQHMEIRLKVGEAKFIRLTEPASAVFLSSPQVADVDMQSAQYVYVVGKGIGSSDLFVLGADNKALIEAKVEVDIDLGRLQSAVSQAVPGSAIRLSTADGAIFVNGTVESDTDAQAAENVVTKLAGDAAVVVNNLKLTTPPQVNLQVTIAEVSRSIEQDLGISVTGSSKNRSLTSPASTIEGYSVSATMGNNLGLVMDALSRSGLATILSEPNLTARSGEQATFLAGGRIPYRVGATQDDTRIEFEPIGVELTFTPTVYDKDQIHIQLDTNVRSIDEAQSTADGKAIAERSASTTVELGSGQSFAIAGMFRADRQQSLTEFPGLAKLPIIGALFRSSAFQRGETELVIIVTPYVVRPTTRNQLKTPLDGAALAPNGVQQMMTGQMVRPDTATGGRPRSQAGFLINR